MSVQSTRLLLNRMFTGMGDWVMMTSVMRMFNASRPDIELDLLIQERHPVNLMQLPWLCGVRHRIVRDGDNPTWICPHVIYPAARPKDDEHILEGMLKQVLRACPGVQVAYDPSLVATPLITKPVPLPSRPFVLMPSCGHGVQIAKLDPRYVHSLAKEWNGFNELARRLSSDYAIVQIGSHGDDPLPHSEFKYFDVPFDVLGFIVQQATYVISLENGLSHFAGQYHRPCFTLYISTQHARPPHTWYPGQVPIGCADGTEPSVDQVYATIMYHRQKCSNTITVL